MTEPEPPAKSEGGNGTPGEQEVAAADPPPAPVNLDPQQQARVNEAAVRVAEIQADRARDDRDLRKDIADKVFKAVLVQVAIADAVFIFFAHKQGWDIAGSIYAWLGAAVVQVIAMALIIIRSVFPDGSGK